MVEDFVKTAVLEKVDRRQFGTIPGTCTTHALVSMVHSWLCATDGNGATVRTILLDFRKAFDVIDHHLLVQKMLCFYLPHNIVAWIVDFITDRRQRVKLQDCYSEWCSVPSGVPQGTILGPWLFIMMINDLDVPGQDISMWKYVDDTTIAEAVNRNESSKLQDTVDELARQVAADKFQLNESKCKELRISFSRSDVILDPIFINDKELECVEDAKILGLRISNNLKWNNHISDIIKKVNSCLYCLSQLKRSGVKIKELLLFYLTCIRPVTEYAYPVYHDSLPQYLHSDIERCQKRALHIIFQQCSYQEALGKAGILTLYERREKSVVKLFKEVCKDRNHKLYHLLPPPNLCKVNLRRKRTFSVQKLNTDRVRKSFIFKNAIKSNF